MKRFTFILPALLLTIVTFSQTKLTTPVLGLASATRTTSFNANWTAVANATGYEVRVYSGATQIGSTISVAGQATATTSITGLTKSTAYQFTVTAIGDGTTYSNSDESSKSSVNYTLPLTSSMLLSTTGMSSTPSTSLEKDGYALNTDPIKQYQWNKGGSQAATPAPTFVDGLINIASVTATRGTVYSITGSSSDFTSAVGALYYGISINMSSAPATAAIFATLDKSYGYNTQRGRLYIKSLENGYIIGGGVDGVPSTYSKTLEFGRTYFVVVKYTISTTDNCAVWINPNTTSSESSADLATAATSTVTYLRGFDIIQQPSLVGKIGAVTFTNSWSDIINPISSLAIPTVGSGNGIKATSFTANWTPVANASGYNVRVYQAGTYLKTVSATGQLTGSVEITGLSSNTTYTYSVAAVGDNSTTFDSYLSTASASVTTATPLAAPVVADPSNIGETNFTANWGAVTGAASYDVYLYDASMVQIGTSTNVANTLTSLEFTGLTKDATYNYKVMAMGDGTTTFNSVLSDAKSVTPSTQTAIQSTQTNNGIVVNGTALVSKSVGNFEVFSAQGKQVASALNTSRMNTNLQKGIYLVRFTSTSGAVMLQKVIIK